MKNIDVIDKLNEQKIRQSIKGSPKGVASVFIKLDDNWGIKLYKYPDKRNDCYELQMKAAEYGLGPDVGELIDFSEYCLYRFGYITEVVEVLIPHELYNSDREDEFNECYDSFTDSSDHNDKVAGLQEELEFKLNTYFHDLHPGNIGIKNGEYVLIDFGND